MTDINNTDPRAPVEAILDDLRHTAADADAESSTDEDATDKLLGLLRPLPAGTAAAAAVDAVSSEPAVASATARRMRLLETVDRELAARRRDLGPLQAVLRRRRQESSTTLEQAAADIALLTGRPVPSAARLASIESGAVDLRDDEPAVQLLAEWAVMVGLPKPAAVDALRASLRTSRGEPFLAAAGSTGSTPLTEQDAHVLAVFETQYDTTAAVEGMS